MISRRGIMRGGAALAGAPAAQKVMQAMNSTVGFGAIGGTVLGAEQSQYAADKAINTIPRSAEWLKTRDLIDAHHHRRRMRLEALSRHEPDIEAMRSWSDGARLRAKIARHKEETTFIQQMQELLWGK